MVPRGGAAASGGITAGTWSWVRSSRGLVAARGACIARQPSRSRGAVPYYACMARVTRHGRRKCPRLPSYAGSLARTDPRVSPPHPLQMPAVKNPIRPVPAEGGAAVPGAGLGGPADNGRHLRGVRWSPWAVSRDPDMRNSPIGARRRSRGVSRMPHMPHTPRPTGNASNVASCMLRNPRPRREPHTHLQVPAVQNPIRPATPTESATRPRGTDAARNRHCGDGPLGILASPNGPAAIPSGGRRAKRGPKNP